MVSVCFIEMELIFISLFIICLFRLLNKNYPPVSSVYQRSNSFYWLKVIFIYTLLKIKKFNYLLQYADYKEKIKFAELEKSQKLSKHSKAIDAVYFNGANKQGDFLVVGTARRKDKLIDGFFYLLLEESGLGLLETLKLPDTSLYQIEETDNYEAEGITLLPVTPMKKWIILFNGKMKRNLNINEIVDVQIKAEWSSNLPSFNFDTDMDEWCMAKSMAFEIFSKEYFENLKANHQLHYEQCGNIKGVATIDGKPYKIDINAVRDHSFGLQREWRNFHRYGLHFLTTEIGDRISVGKICLPISFSRLTIGYVYCTEKDKIYPVQWCDLELHQHGENGKPPREYAFSFTAGNRLYRIKVNVLHSPHFYISKDWESTVFERLCRFDVNGKKGWGAAEWQYRNTYEKNI